MVHEWKVDGFEYDETMQLLMLAHRIESEVLLQEHDAEGLLEVRGLIHRAS